MFARFRQVESDFVSRRVRVVQNHTFGRRPRPGVILEDRHPGSIRPAAVFIVCEAHRARGGDFAERIGRVERFDAVDPEVPWGVLPGTWT